MSSIIKGHIFIVGCPRSGTTLLQSLLAAHPQIASFPESHFFESLEPTQAWLRHLGLGLSSGNRARFRLNKFFQLIGQESQIKSLPKRAFLARQYTQVFVQVLDELTQQQGKNFWIEKTPGHLRHLSLIEKLVPQAKFLHIIRSGRDNIASLYEVTQKHAQWGGPRNIDEAINRWIEDINITDSYLDKPDHSLVQYEDLVANTESVLQEVCRFLTVPFDPVMMQDYGKAAKQVIRQDEAWKQSVSDPIKSANGKKFYQLFTPEQQTDILAKIAPINLEILHQKKVKKLT